MEVLEVITPAQLTTLLSFVKNPKHRVIILLMYDAGLRISEVLNLEWTDLDFRRKNIRVYSLKKRNQDKPKADREFRDIPMSSRIYDAFAVYLEDLGGKKHRLAFTNAKGQKMYRTAINNMLKEIQYDNPQLGNLNPHKCRHSFATNMRANGAELEDIKDLLGHERLDTTLIYAHADPKKLKSLIEAAQPQPTFWQRFKKKFTGQPKPKISLMQTGSDATFGRDTETRGIAELIDKNISVLLTGPAGIGKTHLLDKLPLNRPVLTLDDTKNLKASIQGILLHLLSGDKEAVAELIYNTRDAAALETKITRESLPNLCKVLVSATSRHEYILKIDNIDAITPGAVKALEILKDHFTVITTARAVKMDRTGFLWNFEKVEIKPLARPDALKFIHHLTYDLELRNATFLYQKVWDTSEGNPRMIYELCDRIHKEPVVDPEAVAQICDNYLGKQIREIDMSMFFLIAFGSFAILRYIGRESDESHLQFIGGIITIVLLFSRSFFSKAKRQYI